MIFLGAWPCVCITHASLKSLKLKRTEEITIQP